MSGHPRDHEAAVEANEADRQEQRAPVAEGMDEPEDDLRQVAGRRVEVPEADAAEQALEVGYDDEDERR